MPASTEMLVDFGNSTKDLIAALAEMDAIIAESKFSLENMSLSTTSTTSTGTPKLTDHAAKSPVNRQQTPSADTLMDAISAIKCTNSHRELGNFEETYLTNTFTKSEMNGRGHHDSSDSLSVMAQLAEEMRMQIELTDGLGGGGQTASHLDKDTVWVLKKWLDQPFTGSSESSENSSDGNVGGGGGCAGTVDRMAEAVKRAEAERDNLQSQLTLIFEQTKTQREKIHDLQEVLLEKTLQLESTEDLLREEMLSRSQLETNKLDLVTEMEDLRNRMLTNGFCTNGSPNGYSSGSLKRRNGSAENTNGYVRTSPVNDMQQLRSELEHEKLRKTVQLLTAKLDEKDMRIRQLEEALRMHNIRESDIITRNGDYYVRSEDSRDGGRKPPPIPRPSTTSSQRKNYMPHSNHSLVSSTVGSDESLARYADSDGNGVSVSNSGGARRRESSSRSTGNGFTPRSRSTDARLARSTAEQASSQQQPLSVQYSRQLGSFRVSPLSPSKSLGEKLSGNSVSSSLSFLRQRSLSHGGSQDQQEVNRCSSVPNLNGRIGSHDSDPIRSSTPKSGFSEDKKHSLRKFFEKFTRSNSPQLDENLENQQQFKRGGTRSTAGPRLQHIGASQRRRWDASSPLTEWTPDMVIQWIEEDVQIPVSHTCKSWLRAGHPLFAATLIDMEKDLGISHPIHRKKLQLAIKSKKELDNHPMGKLDYLMILRWLDDLGLPQYKDVFADARIDGRTLNFLTADDLFQLKINNAIHQSSIKTGIQVLRECNFDMSRIRRRTAPNDSTVESPSTVLYWSNQRVLEWLHFLDLTEYQPCLRGSGVHGGLMVLEDRFNAELLAELMSIPQTKTLLRRHLIKSFTELLGGEVIRRKRAREAAPGFVSLSPQLKLKPVRRSFSLVRKKSKSDQDAPDYICPLDLVIDHTAFDNPMNYRKDSSDMQPLYQEDSYNSQPGGETSTSSNSLTLTTV